MRTLTPDVTKGPRADILACVSAVPGIHLRSVERETALPLGQVLYHLDRLERMGLVVSARDAGFRRYYLSRDVARGEKRYLAALRHEVPRRVLLILLASPRQNHRELQGAVGVAGSTLSFHLQRLLTSGVLLRERAGTANFYSIAEPATVRRSLVYYRESFRDPEVDRYVRAQLDRLPALDEAWVHVPVGGAEQEPSETSLSS
jgi:predicted transcriptional regulator